MSSGAGSSNGSAQDQSAASDQNPTKESISKVEYYGLGENSCGYCKTNGVRTSNTRLSYDMRAHTLTASDYQNLLDRGWRRSGSYCYHPVNSSSCCPNYPIQCKPLEYRFMKSQRRCIARLNHFLVHGSEKSQRLDINYNVSSKTQLDVAHVQHTPSSSLSKFEELRSSPKAKAIRFVKRCERKAKLCSITLEEAISRTRAKANLRAEQRESTGSLEDYLYPLKRHQIKETIVSLKPKHKLEIRLCHVGSKFSESLLGAEHEIIQRYQKTIHEDKESDWDMAKYCNFLVESPLITEKLSDNFDYVKLASAEDDNYHVIDTSIDPNEYLLVKPPELPTAFGTHHCSYHLDGKLIAVGVLDLLPKCLSTVYFFYDPTYGFLNLGTYSALVEISIVRQMTKHYTGAPGSNELINYNLGYYVHECKKMHYKTRFRPAQLLCSETCTWVPIENCLDKLKSTKYSRFCTDTKLDGFSIYTAEPTVQIMLEVPIISPVTGRSKLINYVLWLQKSLGPEYANLFIDRVLLSYIRLVGEALVPKILLQLETIHRALVDRHERTESKRQSSQSDSD